MDNMTAVPDYVHNDPEYEKFLKEYYDLESPEQKLQRRSAEDSQQRKVVHDNLIDQLTRARLRRRLTQADLAHKIGVGQPVISRLESRKTNPKLATILKICEALDVSLMVQYN